MEGVSLPSLFEQARKIHQAASEHTVDQDTLEKGCEDLRQCEDMISKLGLFSSNETKEDISTINLKYILVPFYFGELTEKREHEDRILGLKAAQAKLKDFISFCESMELVPKDELEFSAMNGANSFADQRAKKIARFKRQKAAEAKLLEIKERKERRLRSTRAAATSAPVETVEDEALDDDDGEEEREAWLMTISLDLCKAFDMMEMLKKEEELLSAIKEKQRQEGGTGISNDTLDERTRKAEAWHRDAATRSRYTKPAPPITCATFAQDVIEGRQRVSDAHDHKHQPMIFGPTSIVGGNPTSERARIAAQVFQPHHRLPTMSIEEAGLKEMEIMNKWQERNVKFMEEANSAWYKENTKPGPTGASNGEDDDEDDDDAAQDKARAWDDWKDDNPRGAGNKKLTPTG